jgi:hypothetical protein
LGVDLSGARSAGDGAQRGALVVIPRNPLLSLAVADGETTTHTTPTGSTGHSRAALLDLALGDGQIATLAAFEAMSDASWSRIFSHGDSASNAVRLHLLRGALSVIILHSEDGSDRMGKTYLLSINGRELASSQQMPGGIPIRIPGVLDVFLLHVGAVGGLPSVSVATVSDLLGDDHEVVGLVTAGADGAIGIVMTATSESRPDAPRAPGAATRVPATATTASSVPTTTTLKTCGTPVERTFRHSRASVREPWAASGQAVGEHSVMGIVWRLLIVFGLVGLLTRLRLCAGALRRTTCESFARASAYMTVTQG